MRTKTAVSLALAWLCSISLARAEQFVMVDLSYTHSAETTKDSHYYPKLPSDTPKDWTKPVDYAHGSVHIVLDVKTKPAGDAPTKYQLCFEGTPSYGCTVQSPTYTKTGRVEWDSPFSSFWYESTVDWSQGVKQMPMILKDDQNNKPAGDPKYMPTDLHVQVTLVSAGAKFAPPPEAGSGGTGAAGAAGASGGGAAGSAGQPVGGASGSGGAAAPAGRAGAAAGGGEKSAAAGTGTAGQAAGAAAIGGGQAGRAPAGGAGARAEAGAAGTSSATAGAGGEAEPSDEQDSGCQAAGGGAHGTSLVLAWLILARRRRRTAAARCG